MTKSRIPIKKVLKEVYKQKGFPTGPFLSCLTCKCGQNAKGGACCRYGVYVDKESYDQIIKHKTYFEKKIGIKIENFFDKRWGKDPEYLGGKPIGTRVIHKTCSFRSPSGQGCEIVNLVFKKNLPRRMIPSACRIYPITWDKGEMFLEKIKKNCVCIDKNNKTKKSIYKTQKKEIEDIFSFKL